MDEYRGINFYELPPHMCVQLCVLCACSQPCLSPLQLRHCRHSLPRHEERRQGPVWLISGESGAGKTGMCVCVCVCVCVQPCSLQCEECLSFLIRRMWFDGDPNTVWFQLYSQMHLMTEASKYILQYLAQCSGHVGAVDRVKERLLLSNPVLEVNRVVFTLFLLQCNCTGLWECKDKQKRQFQSVWKVHGH